MSPPVPSSVERSALDALADEVLEASKALVAVAARSIADVPPDVGIARFRALVVLSDAEPRLVRELADELGVHASSASRLCDGLVEGGLITRRTSPHSRRQVELRLTPKGRRLVARVLARRRQEIVRILEHLPPTRRRVVADALGSFTAAAEHAGPPGGTPRRAR